MIRLIAKLLVLVAVLLMPFGMAPAAATVTHHEMAAGMPTEHCPDQESDHGAKGGMAECTMACAAALPAADAPVCARLLIVCDRIFPAAAERLHGLHPETADPPPKHS